MSERVEFISQQGAKSIADEINKYRLFGKVEALPRPITVRGQYKGHGIRLDQNGLSAGWLTEEQYDKVIASRRQIRVPWATVQ